MSSDNPSGAVNQQERPSCTTWLDAIPADLGDWVSGFVDGEGSFNIPIRRLRSGALPYRISLSFNVSQIGPEEPRLLREVFGTGTVRPSGDGVWYFEVTTASGLTERVLPFFDRYRSEERSGTTSRCSDGLLLSSRQVGTCHKVVSWESSSCEAL
jgi:hypothetical protein